MPCEGMNAGANPAGNPNLESNPYWLLSYYRSSDKTTLSFIYYDEHEALEEYEHAINSEDTFNARLERCFRIREYEPRSAK